MEYLEHTIITPSLRPFVRCIWSLRTQGNGAAERVLPDGCCEIVLHRSDPFRRLGPGLPDMGVVQPFALVVGPSDGHLFIHDTGDVDLIGVRFEPTGLRALLGVAMHELRGRHLDLDDVDRPLARRLWHAVRRQGFELAVARLERTLEERLPVRFDQGVVEACRLLSEDAFPIEATARAIAVGTRQLERQFRDAVGLSPKRFASLMRFQRVVQRIDRARPLDWGGLAIDAGYYDQSHLIREFRRFAGQSPDAYLREQTPLNDAFFQAPGEPGRAVTSGHPR